jgi:glycogen operon protein
VNEEGDPDVLWLRSDGTAMTEADWRNPDNRKLGMLLPGEATDEVDDRGRPIAGNTLLLLLNGDAHARSFTLPEMDDPGFWTVLVNTDEQATTRHPRASGVRLVRHSLALLSYTAHSVAGG